MIEARDGPTFFELDLHASEPNQPYAIVTADCSKPHEIDDGIRVERIETAFSKELYRVSVFAADTSEYYKRDDVVNNVYKHLDSRYYRDGTGAQGYDPMLPTHLVKSLHFEGGTVRDALVVSYLVGPEQPPSDVDITFGKVEVLKNFTYKKFGAKCRYSPSIRPVGRAAALTAAHLQNQPEQAEEAHDELIHVPKDLVWKRGSDINKAFMIAANHLVAKVMQRESGLIIYRNHDLSDKQYTKLMGDDVAWFDWEPGFHEGLGLRGIARVTSALRRPEDFINHGLLRARHENRELTGRDQRLVTEFVRRMNAKIIHEQYMGIRKRPDSDRWPIADVSAAVS